MGETTKRVISSAILVPLLIFCFHYPNWYYLQLYALGFSLIYLGISEFYHFSNKGDDGKPFFKTGFFFAVAIFSVYFLQLLAKQDKVVLPESVVWFVKIFQDANAFVVPLIILLFIFSFVLQILTRPLEGAIHSVSSTIAGVLYLGVTMGHFMILLSLKYGTFYIWLVAGMTFVTDGGAYFGGRWFGRHPAGLKISPKKTWEGYITGVISANVYSFILRYIWENVNGYEIPFSSGEIIFFSTLFALISVAGDLAESAMKRDAKLKDSASVIPGHGGVLDLVDAVLFTLPCSYFYLTIKSALGYPI